MIMYTEILNISIFLNNETKNNIRVPTWVINTLYTRYIIIFYLLIHHGPWTGIYLAISNLAI